MHLVRLDHDAGHIAKVLVYVNIIVLTAREAGKLRLYSCFLFPWGLFSNDRDIFLLLLTSIYFHLSAAIVLTSCIVSSNCCLLGRIVTVAVSHFLLKIISPLIRLLQSLIKFLVDENMIIIAIFKISVFLLQFLIIYTHLLDFISQILHRLLKFLNVSSLIFLLLCQLC